MLSFWRGLVLVAGGEYPFDSAMISKKVLFFSTTSFQSLSICFVLSCSIITLLRRHIAQSEAAPEL